MNDIMETNGRLAQLNVAEDALYRGNAMQQVRTQFTTAVAVQKPRSLMTVQKNLLEEARLAGDEFYYGWGAGDNHIEGPSVGLAMAAVRCYGNCAVDMLPVQETRESWIFTASFVDVETGFTLTRQFRQSKAWKVHGKMDEERKSDVRFQIGQSKAIRNVVLNAVPKGLVRVAMEEAKKGVREKIEAFIAKSGLPAAVDLVLKSLLKNGISEAHVLAKIGIASKQAMTVDHLVILRGDISAIENGQERANDLYPVEEAKGKAEELLSAPPPKTAEKPKEEKPTDETASEETHAAVVAEITRVGLSEKQVVELAKQVGAKRIGRLTASQAQRILDDLRELPDAREPGSDD